MNCPRCSTPIPEHSRFCLSCGANLSGETGTHTLEIDPGIQKRLQEELGQEFVIEREVGRGGMAVVYLAHDMRLGRKVAIKVLPPELTFGKPESVERFRREARTAATLDHPNIIPIYRVSGDDGLVWYVMKYLEGESLDQALRRVFRFGVDATVRVVEQAAAALEHAHERGVVHRDVKPANMVMGAKGWVTVTDFGIAKAMDSTELTASGAAMGTPFYMSPEQCSGTPVTGSSDQYALGVMTYQMLCGRVPFTGQSVVDIVKKHCLDPVPPLLSLQPDLPEMVARVVEKALAKTPDERFATVTSFGKALSLASQGVDVDASFPDSSDPMHGAKTVIIDPKAQRRVRRASLNALASAAAAAAEKGRQHPLALAGALALMLVAGSVAAKVLWPSPGAAIQADSTTRHASAPVAASPPPVTPTRSDTAPSGTAHRNQRVTPSPARADAPRPTLPAAPARGPTFLTLGSRPLAAMSINGNPVTPPVVRYQVPAGRVVVHFQVTDTSGVWPFDTTFTLAPGDTNLGRIQLHRPPPRP